MEMDNEIQNLIVDGVRAVLSMSRTLMGTDQEEFLRRALIDGESVKVTIPYTGDMSTKVCQMLILENDAKDPVWFVYRNEEQPDLARRFMRPVSRLIEDRKKTETVP